MHRLLEREIMMAAGHIETVISLLLCVALVLETMFCQNFDFNFRRDHERNFQ